MNTFLVPLLIVRRENNTGSVVETVTVLTDVGQTFTNGQTLQDCKFRAAVK